jgi:hypothetical protein
MENCSVCARGLRRRSRVTYRLRSVQIQIDRVTEDWKFRPFRFKQFDAAAGVHDEIHFAGAVAREK